MGKNNQQLFWEQAGRDGYGKAMFSNTSVELHIRTTIWNAAIKTAKTLGLNSNSRIIELGCGDGIFSGTVLAKNFHSVDGYDRSVSAIERSNVLHKSESVRFHVSDVREMVYLPDQHWDGAFLMGFLHHVKKEASIIISRLSEVTPLVVVVDPNGNNPVRKFLEYLPSYRKAGEDSFRLSQLDKTFNSARYELVSRDIVSLVPPFTPSVLFPTMVRFERIIESCSILKMLNSTYILGFKRV